MSNSAHKSRFFRRIILIKKIKDEFTIEFFLSFARKAHREETISLKKTCAKFAKIEKLTILSVKQKIVFIFNHSSACQKQEQKSRFP